MLESRLTFYNSRFVSTIHHLARGIRLATAVVTYIYFSDRTYITLVVGAFMQVDLLGSVWGLTSLLMAMHRVNRLLFLAPAVFFVYTMAIQGLDYFKWMGLNDAFYSDFRIQSSRNCEVLLHAAFWSQVVDYVVRVLEEAVCRDDTLLEK